MELPRLYAIADLSRYGEPFLEKVERVLEKGVRMLQLRAKGLPARRLYELAKEVRALTRRYGALFIVNARADAAAAVGADGVHLPEAGLPPEAVKRVFPNLLVGFSAHSLESALEAQRQGADFVTFSPVFRTASHPEAEPKGLEELKRVAEALSVPVYALGGVTAGRVRDCLEAGAYGVAGIGLFLENSFNISDLWTR
ncbi:MAG: thiamine phosphate synthase [Aquificae bacterium]|nr:thiamine phosphate synthase [Aquificota bacterium]